MFHAAWARDALGWEGRPRRRAGAAFQRFGSGRLAGWGSPFHRRLFPCPQSSCSLFSALRGLVLRVSALIQGVNWAAKIFSFLLRFLLARRHKARSLDANVHAPLFSKSHWWPLEPHFGTGVARPVWIVFRAWKFFRVLRCHMRGCVSECLFGNFYPPPPPRSEFSFVFSPCLILRFLRRSGLFKFFVSGACRPCFGVPFIPFFSRRAGWPFAATVWHRPDTPSFRPKPFCLKSRLR
jgi:hypothetical protein